MSSVPARTSEGAELVHATSTAEAARIVGEPSRRDWRDRPALAGRLYGLETVVQAGGGPSGQTRPVSCWWREVCCRRPPAMTARAWSAFSRPTVPATCIRFSGIRRPEPEPHQDRVAPDQARLGDYCFVIELEGHLSDEVVGGLLEAIAQRARLREVPRLLPRFRERGPSDASR